MYKKDLHKIGQNVLINSCAAAGFMVYYSGSEEEVICFSPEGEGYLG